MTTNLYLSIGRHPRQVMLDPWDLLGGIRVRFVSIRVDSRIHAGELFGTGLPRFQR